MDTLEILKILTDKIQKEQFTITDFFIEWLELKKKEDMLAKNLLECINEREVTLFENEALVAAIFLDPRVQVIIQLVTLAESHLLNLWKNLQQI